jgi:hypothetical protein
LISLGWREKDSRLREIFSTQDPEITMYIKEHMLTKWKSCVLSGLLKNQVHRLDAATIKKSRRLDKKSILGLPCEPYHIPQTYSMFIISDVKNDPRFESLLDGRTNKFITIHIAFIDIYPGTLYFKYSFSERGIIKVITIEGETFNSFKIEDILITDGVIPDHCSTIGRVSKKYIDVDWESGFGSGLISRKCFLNKPSGV